MLRGLLWFIPLLAATWAPGVAAVQAAHETATAAHESAEAAPLTFAAALELAATAPGPRSLAAALAQQRQIDARLSRLTQNPQLTGQLGYRFLSEPERGLEAQVYLNQAFNLAGHAGARRRAARKEEDTLGAELLALKLVRRLQAAEAWLGLWGATQALSEARRELELAGEFLRRVERAAQGAVLTKVDVAEAQTYLAETQLGALALEGEVFDLGITLARVCGQMGAARTSGGLPAPPLLGTAEAQRLQELAGALPEPRARAQAAQAEDARIAELRASRGGQVQLGIGYMREAPSGMAALGTFGLQLPVFDRGERELGPLRAAGERLRGDAEEAALKARGDIAQVLHEVVHSGEILAQIRDHLVPASEETVRLREAALRAGETTVLELLIARRAAALARGRLRRAESSHALARARVQLLNQAVGEGQP